MNKPFSVHRLMPNDIVTEDRAAQQFVELHGDKLRYCHSHGKWFRWNGFYWEINNTSLAFHAARELARQLAEDQDDRKRYKIEATSFAGGVERFAKCDPNVAVTMEFWDRDPWLLGTPGGTVDLRTGEFKRRDHAGLHFDGRAGEEQHFLDGEVRDGGRIVRDELRVRLQRLFFGVRNAVQLGWHGVHVLDCPRRFLVRAGIGQLRGRLAVAARRTRAAHAGCLSAASDRGHRVGCVQRR